LAEIDRIRPYLTGGLVWWIAIPLVLIVLVIISQSSTAVVWHEGIIEEIDVWADDDWAGGPYTVEYSYDGSMVMLVGYGGPNEVRIMARDMSVLGLWELTEPNLSIDGASWSTSDDMIAVWCTNGTEDNDTVLILSVPEFELMDGLNLSAIDHLVDITSARLIHGVILVIGGIDAEGASRFHIFETGTGHSLYDINWSENAAIIAIDYDGIYLLALDDKGFITNFETMGWSVATRWEGSGSPPSASCIGYFVGDRIWMVGYENGKVRLWGEGPLDLIGEPDAGEGPVLGVASLFPDPRYYAVAVPQGSSGSRITGWIHNATWGEKEWSNVIQTDARVLSMVSDPQVEGQFLAAFDNGSIGSYHTTIIENIEPIVFITAPPRKATWEGVMTVKGEVFDEGGRVDWVRYSFDGSEWMDAEGTDEFTFDVDTADFSPATHTMIIKAFDGIYEGEARYDFSILENRDDDEGKDFWNWFIGCTLIFVVVLIVLIYVLRVRKGPPH